MSNTLFPTLHMAKKVGFAVIRKHDHDGSYTDTVKFAGKKVGTVYHLPHGAGEDFHIPAGVIADVAKGFVDQGFKNSHPELFPNPTNELWLLSICYAVLNESVDLKKMKRKAKTNIMFVMKGAEYGDYFEVTAPFTPEMKSRVLKQNPPDSIAYFINEDIAEL